MRTLAATFRTRADAEAARQSLEGVGIARDRIILKDVAAAGAAATAAGEVFLTVKVTTDQVRPASDALKVSNAAQPSPSGSERKAVRRGDAVALPLGQKPRDPAPPPPAIDSETAAPHPPGRAVIGGMDRAQFGRYAAIYCLILLAAFMAGAGLGLVS